MKTSVRTASLATLATLAGSFLACTTVVEDTTTGTPSSVPDDIADALAALPEAKVIAFTDDGVPTFIVGELAQVGAMPADAISAEAALRPALGPVVAPFRLEPEELAFQRMGVDESGGNLVHRRVVPVQEPIKVVAVPEEAQIDARVQRIRHSLERPEREQRQAASLYCRDDSPWHTRAPSEVLLRPSSPHPDRPKRSANPCW